jgi:hypothetical protein
MVAVPAAVNTVMLWDHPFVITADNSLAMRSEN